MVKLDDICEGSVVRGIAGDAPVSIVAVKYYGDVAAEVTYKDLAGQVASKLIYREDAEKFELSEKSLPWRFDGDGETMRLVSEAYRIHLAHLFDPYLAVHTSAVEPLPHQISAVYKEMLPRIPLRYVLADDPGAGKTIMTGLYIKELIARGDLHRCMIVCPGNLAEQWQDELYSKFNLRFDILTNDKIESAVTGNVFKETNWCIARLDKLARNEDLQEKMKAVDYDLIVVDEAHKLSATVFGGEVKYTKRYLLGRLLSSITRNFLMLTATPHNGKGTDFQLFMALIDPDRFEGQVRNSNQSIDVSDCMRRLVKEELLKFDGRPLFPERHAYTVNYTLSPAEAKLYAAVTDYVQEEFNRADALENKRKTTVGFALTILQRRLASSPEAIYQSLRRRREKLEARLAEEKIGRRGREYSLEDAASDGDIDDIEDDYDSSDLENTEEEVVDQATAARTIAEMEAEIATLRRLEQMANEVRASGEDRKWDELSHLLQESANMFGEDGQREKLIIFTEHKDTLNYLAQKIRSLLGSEKSVVTIHGGMLRDERKKVEALFKQDKDVLVLVATDAAGEGINLQRAHLMINYDLPWNPNRLEQRFGRVHRIGQTEVCYMWNLVAGETREGQVFERLFKKLEEESKALHGRVFDILGKLTFNNKPLRELLIDAVRHGNDPETRAKLNQVVDNSVSRKQLQELLDERSLTRNVMDVHQVMEIQEDMERMEAHKLQPHFVESFFLKAFQLLGGEIRPREAGRYEILRVPYAIRSRDRIIGCGQPVLQRYERVCFDKDLCNVEGRPVADLICPGHPLMEATIDLIMEQHRDVLKRGTVYIDENDLSTEPRLLFYIEDTIQDGYVLENGQHRTISKQFHFVELRENGPATDGGYAPYLDYRGATDAELAVVRPHIEKLGWLRGNVEEKASQYAIMQIIPPHFEKVRNDRLKLIQKAEKAVKERLSSEINYWDYRSAQLKEKEDAGKSSSKLNSANAARRAEDLNYRMEKRLKELEQEKQISALPPVISGGAVVIPAGLLVQLHTSGSSTVSLFGGADKRSMELEGMKAVMALECSLGFEPKDVSAVKCGYDIESRIPEGMREENGGRCLRQIEVKARQADSTTVTVSKNEVLCGLNNPEDFILAVVQVDGETHHITYFKNPFHHRLDFSISSVNIDIADLKQNAQIILEQ